MKKILIFFLLLSTFITENLQASVNNPVIQAGMAQTDITPPLGCPMWGYDARKEGAAGVLDPLLAKVLILKSTDTTVAMVSWDICEFQSPWLRDKMHELGITELLIFNSHTHAGPFLDTPNFPSPEKPWKRTVEERILEAIRQAQKNMFPVFLAAGEGSIQLGYNRLRRDPDGLATTLFENPDRIPYEPVDPTVGVIRVTDTQGAIRAVIVHYACHPVVLGPLNRMFSADYVGAMYRKVEKTLGPNVSCLFVQGGCGDINPLFLARTGDKDKDYPVVIKMGEYLADEVLQTLDRMKTLPGKSEQLLATTKLITVQNRWKPEKTLRFGTTSMLINQEIGIVTLPGEPFHKFQKDVREMSKLPHAYMFGYCDNSYQDWPNWYLPDIESAARGGYGASDSGEAEVGTGERLTDTGLIQLYTLRGMLHEKPEPGRMP